MYSVNNEPTTRDYKPRTISIAPMLDWTDRHCRMFHRQITRCAWLYSEMVTTGAIIHGDRNRHLDFNETEHPLALQLGGSEPGDLAFCARLGEKWGYDEINLNCGCPSERVQKGAFGACLMAEKFLVADCIKAMQDAVSIDVTVKHRIGIDDEESYGFVRDFIGTVATTGCNTFIVHARKAILKGLSPKENRDVPPLHYDVVYRLKRDFPNLEILLNGGVAEIAEIDEHLRHVDGVMIGRAAYHNPYLMAVFDSRYYGQPDEGKSRHDIIETILPYVTRQLSEHGRKKGGTLRLHNLTRHMLGLMNGMPGARRFRQILSDPDKLAEDNPGLLLEAAAAVRGRALPTGESGVESL